MMPGDTILVSDEQQGHVVTTIESVLDLRHVPQYEDGKGGVRVYFYVPALGSDGKLELSLRVLWCDSESILKHWKKPV